MNTTDMVLWLVGSWCSGYCAGALFLYVRRLLEIATD